MDKFVRTSSHKRQKDHHGYIKCLKKRKKKSYLTSDKKKTLKKQTISFTTRFQKQAPVK